MNLSVFKKLSLIMCIASIGIACLVIFGTCLSVNHNFWQEQGTIRAVLIGGAITIIFMIYSTLCFRSFKAPTIKNISIIYGVQSVLFFTLMLLSWAAIFLPA